MSEIIAPWKETKWIVLSSCFFLIPSWYSYKNNFILDAYLLGVTSLISINYWRNAINSWRREVDLFYSKTMIVVFVSKGFVVLDEKLLFLALLGVVGVGYCYHCSCKYHLEQKQYWFYYHTMFHFLLTCELLLITENQRISKQLR